MACHPASRCQVLVSKFCKGLTKNTYLAITLAKLSLVTALSVGVTNWMGDQPSYGILVYI